MKVRHFFLFLCSLTSGCRDVPGLQCKEDWECHDWDLNPGRCLPSSRGLFCALPDKRCTSGWRWTVTADELFSSMCVDPTLPLDGGADAGADQNYAGG